MLLSAVSVLVVAQSSSEIPEGLMNNPVFWNSTLHVSDGLSVHHQESQNVHTESGICHTGSGNCLLAGSWLNQYDICLILCVQSYTPYDGRKDRPKHVECWSKIKWIWDIVHLVGFTIETFWLCSVWVFDVTAEFIVSAVFMALNMHCLNSMNNVNRKDLKETGRRYYFDSREMSLFLWNVYPMYERASVSLVGCSCPASIRCLRIVHSE